MSSAQERLNVLRRHLQPGAVDMEACSARGSSRIEVEPEASTIPKRRQDLLKWNGWGYKDTNFRVMDNEKFQFIGERYSLNGAILPDFKKFVEEMLNVNLEQKQPSQPELTAAKLPAPVENLNFLTDLKSTGISFTNDAQDRLFRSHGHTMKEIFILRESHPPRIADLVVWPLSHKDCVTLVDIAGRHNVVLIPVGGATNVTQALWLSAKETRMIVAVDTTQMCQILWIDEKNLTACCQSGIIGQDLERRLAKKGYQTGHEPDSMEFSSLGGWISTRASGMKKNLYGNIEQMVVHIKAVTPHGVIQKNNLGPRTSSGPDLHHIIMGSEGTLGIVTEVVLKIHPLPECRKYGSIVFPNLEQGILCIREVAEKKCAPASIRLMDNTQFVMGHALKPENNSTLTTFVDGLKKLYLTKFKGIDVKEMCAMTLLFEGRKEEVAINEKQVYEIGAKYGGIPGGEENGRRGYTFTFVIAYIRDIGLDYHVLAESFETSVPWDRLLDLCRNTMDRVQRESKERGVTNKPLICCRITQTYDAGACVYFYYAFNARGLANPMQVFEEVEHAAREEILANGGNISHHHGVGKLRKHWLEQSISSPGVDILRAVKNRLDPQNIFASGNLMME